MNENMKKEPSLRFKGFTDTWEQRKLGEVILWFKGSKLAKSELNRNRNGHAVIHYADLYTFDPVVRDVIHYSTSNEGTPIPDNSILFPMSDVTPDGLARTSTITKSGVLAGGDILIGEINCANSAEFLSYQINANSNHIIPLITGTTVRHINAKALGSLDIFLSGNMEQIRIADLFNTLQNLITIHQRKLELLKGMKKTLLSKMFPKNNEQFPELRFKGFTDAWEQRKFLTCIEKIIDFRGRTPKKLGMNWSESGYLALSALNVKDGYIDFMQDVHYGDQELYDKWMTGNELHKGQVLFTTEAPMGNVAQIPDNKGYILSQRTIAFSVKKDLITENFLAIILRSPNVMGSLLALSSGGTAKGVSQKSLSVLEIRIPNALKEQEQLGEFFKSLDQTITIHQRKLELLKDMKKSLLKSMFI